MMASPQGTKFAEYWTGYFDLLDKEHPSEKKSPDAVTGPELLDRYKANEDVNMIHVLPCKDFQRKIHLDDFGHGVKEGCGYLQAGDVNKVKGIHWGTESWAWGKRADGGFPSATKIVNDETRYLFQRIHPKQDEAKAPAQFFANYKNEEPETKLPLKTVLVSADPDTATDDGSVESWKSAFFFFASLVLMVILAGLVMSGLYYSRQQSEKANAPETAPLSSAGLINESSSTSDSGEKIAMLFDRVRQSLEDLSDKTPAQGDMAGGHGGGRL